jgi:hypothetical protein
MPAPSLLRHAADVRGVSPVVGTMLLAGVVLVLSIVVLTMAFGLSLPADRPPTATFEMAEGECDHELRHATGNPIDGNRTELTGVEDPDALAGRTLTAGDTVSLDPTGDEVVLAWYGSDGGGSAIIERFDVDPDAPRGCSTVLSTAAGGSIDGVGGDDEPVRTLSATSDATALGPADGDLTGDGTADTPFVEGGDTVVLTNETNGTTTLADDGDIPGAVEGSKTRLAVGSWDGSPESVFFANENQAKLYRVAPSTSPVAVATPGDGVQAVSGTGDVDGDDDDELVFADASQRLRYLDADGTTAALEDGQAGSDVGIGAGAVADLDDDGVASVVAVDGNNDVKIAGVPTADGGEGTTVITAADAEKSPPTVADVDGDGEDEIVYVGLADGDLRYIDDVRGNNEIAFLRDDGGDRIAGSAETGAV